MARRLELLAWARDSAAAFLIEDDYTSEFRYSGPPHRYKGSMTLSG